MRSTSGTRTALTPATPRAERTTGRSTATAARPGIQRPTLRDTPGREKKSGSRAGVGTGGWAGYNKAKAERSEAYPSFRVKEKESVLIRFAEAEPFAYIFRHWVGPKGKGVPWTCIKDADNDIDCPLCDVKHKAGPVMYFNVITVSDGTLRVWEASKDPIDEILEQYDFLAQTDKTLDDPGYYFVVSKYEKDNGFFEYNLRAVKTRDLAEELGVDPLDDDEITHATRKGLFDDSIIQVPTAAQLRDVVDKMTD